MKRSMLSIVAFSTAVTIAACGGGATEDAGMEADTMLSEPMPAPAPAPEPMDTMPMDTTMMDTAATTTGM